MMKTFEMNQNFKLLLVGDCNTFYSVLECHVSNPYFKQKPVTKQIIYLMNYFFRNSTFRC